jgi:hypothetical protein
MDDTPGTLSDCWILLDLILRRAPSMRLLTNKNYPAQGYAFPLFLYNIGLVLISISILNLRVLISVLQPFPEASVKSDECLSNGNNGPWKPATLLNKATSYLYKDFLT